jgi:hypothetical protein
MFCPKCGKSNAENFKFCLNCGEDLEQARATAPAATIPTAQGPAPASMPHASTAANALVQQMLQVRSASDLAALAGQLSRLQSASIWTGGDEPETLPPDPAPRALPAQFYTQYVPPWAIFSIPFGALFSAAGAAAGIGLLGDGLTEGSLEFVVMGLLFGGIFGGIGAIAIGLGLKRLFQTRRIWREGHITVGRIARVGYDMSTRVNGRNPILVSYTYEIEGQPHRGTFSSMSPVLLQYKVGQPVHILYDARHPEQSVLAHGQPRALTAQGGW